MRRALMFAAGAGLALMALRGRRSLFGLPLGMIGVGLMSNAIDPGRADSGDSGPRRLGDDPMDEAHAAAPGAELPAWW